MSHLYETHEAMVERWVKSRTEHVMEQDLQIGGECRVAHWMEREGPGGKTVTLLSIYLEFPYSCAALIETEDGVLYRVRVEDLFAPKKEETV